MQRFAEEELGVEFKFDGMINARIDCSHSPLDVRLDRRGDGRARHRRSARRAEWAQPGRAERSGPPAGATRGDRLSVRRRHQRVRDRSGREDDHLRAVAAGQRSICARGASRRGGRASSARCAQDDHAPHQVHRLPHSLAVLDVRGHQRARARRRGDAGRVLLRGGAPARPRGRLSRRPRTATAPSARAARATRICCASRDGRPARERRPASRRVGASAGGRCDVVRKRGLRVVRQRRLRLPRPTPNGSTEGRCRRERRESRTAGPRRKPYEKPTLSEVALRPDEAVLGSCKTMSAGPVEA